MAELELEQLEAARPRSMHLEWTFPLLFRPASTLKRVSEQERGVWIAPLLIISILAIMVVLITAPARKIQVQSSIETPQDFQYWPPEMQQEYMDNQANKSNTLFIYIFPAAGAAAGVWITWFLLGSILHLGLTLTGSRGSNTSALNLVGWAALPLALRYAVQAVAALSTKQLIASPALSGFIAADATGFMVFLRGVLSQIDIYFIWMVILLLVGVLPMTGLTRSKAWGAVLVSVLIIVALKALPAFIGGQLSGLSTSSFF